MKKYFEFKGTINGSRYFLRMFLQQYLIGFFGLGLYLMAVTSYQRASAFTESKSRRILLALNPVLANLVAFPLFFQYGYEDDLSVFFEDTLSSLFTILILITIIIHWCLVLKNGNKKIDQNIFKQ